MSANYEILPYQPELKAGLAELLTHLWGGNVEVNAAHLEWKYEQNPYIGEPRMQIGVYEGRVVGMRTWFGTLWTVGETEVLIPCGADACVAPSHRRHGLFARLHLAGLQDLDGLGSPYGLSLSTAPIPRHTLLQLGWREIGSLGMRCWPPASEVGWRVRAERYAKGIKGLRTLYLRLRRYGDGIGLGERVARRSPFAALDASGLSAPLGLAREPRPAEMADLAARVARDGRIRHVRDAGYFAWRFRNPRSEYRFLFWGPSEPEGYLILRAARFSSRREVRIVDWVAGEDEVAAALLNAVLESGSFADVRVWSMALAEGERRILEAAGFEPLPETGGPLEERATALLRPAPGAEATCDWTLAGLPVLDPTSWDIRMIDSDAV